MIKPVLLTTLGLTATAAMLAAAEPDLSKLPAPSKKTGLTYAKDIRPILEGSCFGCHGEQRQKGDLRVDNLEALMKGSEHGKVVTAGKSDKSPLVIATAQIDDKTAMPPKPRQGGPGRGPGGPGGPGRGGVQGGGPGGGGGGGEAGQGGQHGPGGPGGRGGGPGGGGFGPPPKPLTAEQVGLIRAWIDQGAK